jgi:surface antigen
MGDAADWLRNAVDQGVATSATPTVGSIVVYHRGGTYNAVDGHVALVVAMTPDTYTVAEMNYAAFGKVDERVIRWPDAEVVGFIP